MRAIMFHLTGVLRKPPRPAADFSKANWGDTSENNLNTRGHIEQAHNTSTLVYLVQQLTPRQWEKILLAAMEASKLNQSSGSTSSSSTQNRPKPQLRDDDSDIGVAE